MTRFESRFRTGLVLLLLFAAAAPGAAQYGEQLTAIAGRERLTRDEALWLIGSAAGSLEVGVGFEEAPEALAGLTGLRGAPLANDGAVTLSRFAHLLLTIEETPVGFWYGVLPGPFTAYRFLQRAGVLSRELPPSHVLSGAEAVDVTRRYLAFVEESRSAGAALPGTAPAGTAFAGRVTPGAVTGGAVTAGIPATEEMAPERAPVGVMTGTSHGEFFWNIRSELSSAFSTGDLASQLEVAPEDAGSDALLSRDELFTAAADGYQVQSGWWTGLDSRLAFGWRAGLVSLDVHGTLLARYAPGGFSDQSGIALAPGELGVRITRFPADWQNGRLSVELGRIRLRDPSGMIVSQLADGAGFGVRFPRLYVELRGGSTALVNKYYYTPRFPSEGTIYQEQARYLAPDRLIAVSSLQAADVLGQDLGLSVVYFDDRAVASSGDRWYVGLSGRGVLVSAPGILEELTHRTHVALQLEESGTPGFSAGLDLRARTSAIPLQAALLMSYASGTAGRAAPFVPVSPSAVGRVLALPSAGLFEATLRLTGTPGSRVQPVLDTKIVLEPGDPAPWVGAELLSGFTYRPLADLRFRVAAGAAQSALGWTPYFSMEGALQL